MTKITEASSLSSLGLSKEQIRGIYKHSGLAMRHDMKFDEVKTKSQATSRLNRHHFIVAVRDGDARVLYKRRGSYHIASPTGKSYHNSMKDALAEIPGKGWSYYSSKADTSDYIPLQKDPEREREDTYSEIVNPVMKQLNKVYGNAARKLAAQAAEDIRNEAIKYLDRDDSEYSGHYMSDNYVHRLRASYKAFKALAESDEPFDTLTGSQFDKWGGKSFDRYINDKLQLTTDRFDWSSKKNIERFIKNAKLPLAKIAKYGLNLIKIERDSVLSRAPDFEKTAGVAKLDKIKKAWESYKKDGNVKPLS
jgi:hypothetical protein